MRPKAVDVQPLDDYKLYVTFDNGENRIYDVKPLIYGEWFEQLFDPEVFKTVHVAGLSVAWCGGQDICPDDLYENSVPVAFGSENPDAVYRMPRFLEGQPVPPGYFDSPDPYADAFQGDINLPHFMRYARILGKDVIDITRDEYELFREIEANVNIDWFHAMRLSEWMQPILTEEESDMIQKGEASYEDFLEETREEFSEIGDDGKAHRMTRVKVRRKYPYKEQTSGEERE